MELYNELSPLKQKGLISLVTLIFTNYRRQFMAGYLNFPRQLV